LSRSRRQRNLGGAIAGGRASRSERSRRRATGEPRPVDGTATTPLSASLEHITATALGALDTTPHCAD
jgi:hypothetical protein